MLRNVIRAAKHNHYNKLLNSTENKTKVTWSIVRNETGKVQNVNHVPSAFNLNQSSIHIDHAAEAFNDYFLNLVDNLKMYNVDADLAISLLKRRFANEYSDMIVIPITESELICTIASIKSKEFIYIRWCIQ
jgi:hypothetical protein